MSKIELRCAVCEKWFWRYKSSERHRVQRGGSGPYCSPACRYRAHRNRVSLVCEECGKMFERKKSRVRERASTYCSQQCHGRNRTADPVERFMEKWEYEDGCWRWTGATHPSGHGAFRGSGKSVLAHRFAFEAYHERDVHDGRELHHVCENPWCVNPLHLEELTRAEHTERHPRARDAEGNFVSSLEEPA